MEILFKEVEWFILIPNLNEINGNGNTFYRSWMKKCDIFITQMILKTYIASNIDGLKECQNANTYHF